MPFGKGRQWLGNTGKLGNAIVGGWQVSGITTYETGLPLDVDFQVPSSYVGWWGGRADRVGSALYAGKSGSHDVIAGVPWFNAAAFAPPQPWAWGNSSPRSVFGPGFVNWDMNAMKSFPLTERIHMQLRGDFLNAFNHFTPGSPNNTIGDTRDGGPPVTSAGIIYGGRGNRIIQVGARLFF